MYVELTNRITQNVTRVGGCWIWNGKPTKAGYGRISVEGAQYYAHRVAYETFVRPIPDGLVIDHVAERGCVSRLCVNPAHLEPVTLQENIRRGRAGLHNKMKAAARKMCGNGHPWSPETTYWDSRRARHCLVCRRATASGRDPKKEPVVKTNRNIQASKTRCPRGHEYSGRNSNGRRICRECDNARRRKRPKSDSDRVSARARGDRPVNEISE